MTNIKELREKIIEAAARSAILKTRPEIVGKGIEFLNLLPEDVDEKTEKTLKDFLGFLEKMNDGEEFLRGLVDSYAKENDGDRALAIKKLTEDMHQYALEHPQFLHLFKKII